MKAAQKKAQVCIMPVLQFYFNFTQYRFAANILIYICLVIAIVVFSWTTFVKKEKCAEFCRSSTPDNELGEGACHTNCNVKCVVTRTIETHVAEVVCHTPQRTRSFAATKSARA